MGFAKETGPPARERELLRERGLFPLREEVRSSRRVWYAKAPAEPPVAFEAMEPERSRELVDLEDALEFVDAVRSIASFNS